MLQTNTNSHFPECITKAVGFETTLKEGCVGIFTVYFEDCFIEESLKDVYERTSGRDVWATENGIVSLEQQTAQ